MKKAKSFETKRDIEFLLNKIYHFFFSERFGKKIDYNFDNTKSRLDLLQLIIKKKKYKTYLEIGCDKNQVFSKIKIKKIGVDPVSGGNFRGTSDEFFKKNKKKFDCIFIDGLHEYQQVLKDIKNSIRFLNDDGMILLHDCLPTKIKYQRVPRASYVWNGDVWKAIVEVRTWDYIDTCTILIDQGIGVIKKEKNKDTLKLKIKNFENLKFSYLYYNYKKLMRVVKYEDFIKKIY